VEGSITLRGHQLTVGSTAQLTSEIHAGEIIVYGKVVGNVHARDRVDVKTDGSVVGDISTARISIEDGAHFKGRIEIDPAQVPSRRRLVQAGSLIRAAADLRSIQRKVCFSGFLMDRLNDVADLTKCWIARGTFDVALKSCNN